MQLRTRQNRPQVRDDRIPLPVKPELEPTDGTVAPALAFKISIIIIIMMVDVGRILRLLIIKTNCVSTKSESTYNVSKYIYITHKSVR